MSAPDSRKMQLLADQLLVRLREQPVAPRVVDAMARVPRHAFVPVDRLDRAYDDVDVPLEHGQFLPSPSQVALMTDKLRVVPSDVVLQVGTGTGYQAAIFARLATRVFVTETLPTLAVGVSMRLQKMGLTNVEVKIGDGARGWREHAPYNAICVTSEMSEVPPALLDQLAIGGRLVIPINGELRLVAKQSVMNTQQQVIGRVSKPPAAGGA